MSKYLVITCQRLPLGSAENIGRVVTTITTENGPRIVVGRDGVRLPFS